MEDKIKSEAGKQEESKNDVKLDMQCLLESSDEEDGVNLDVAVGQKINGGGISDLDGDSDEEVKKDDKKEDEIRVKEPV